MVDSSKVMDKCLKITLIDDRIIYGILNSIDKDTNLVLMDSTI